MCFSAAMSFRLTTQYLSGTQSYRRIKPAKELHCDANLIRGHLSILLLSLTFINMNVTLILCCVDISKFNL